MRFDDYVRAMDEVHADQEKLLEKLHNKEFSGGSGRQSRFLLRVCAALLALAVLSAVWQNISLPGQEQGFTILVHAAGSEDALRPGDAVSVQCRANRFFEVYSEDDSKGFVNYDLWLECMGEEIASVTYRCHDIPVTKENMGTVPCYFVRNRVIPSGERTQYDYIQLLQSELDQEQGICTIVQLIGNEYTVTYGEQEGQCTGIEIHMIREGDAARAEPVRIDILLNMTDGSVRNQTLILTPGNDAFDDLMRIEFPE